MWNKCESRRYRSNLTGFIFVLNHCCCLVFIMDRQDVDNKDTFIQNHLLSFFRSKIFNTKNSWYAKTRSESTGSSKCRVRILTGNRPSILPEMRMSSKWGGCFEYLAVHDTLGSPSYEENVEWKTRRNRGFHFKTFQKGQYLWVCMCTRARERVSEWE